MLLALEREMHVRGHETTVAACATSQVAGKLFATGDPTESADQFERCSQQQTRALLDWLGSGAVSRFDLNLFYPALMILLGAHYLPFVFLYGMRIFAVLAAFLLGGGVIIAKYPSSSFSIGAWHTGIVLLIVAVVGKLLVDKERDRNTVQPPLAADGA